ncbi:MAG: Galactose-1-phosphate uridylyltransferase [candidate division WWE3 bacterium GW2011_GWA1_46_21]|uniref:Galactose-1-phosphate uridylyltransferase n=2 Tax=Katanobacteria TaxID=422282 RepID=A0A0G1SAN1_UNCKA|nr:MAG: Galactose-1-phosphate uridylyltransferase [candidate division WWE3 bacterium GW2011_GWA1_46_21]KKU48162.1 MAG: Galactose-1-phosphate uridylyltransferase [candidate division WWE3 bacterium GW2011_GWA2_46_9]
MAGKFLFDPLTGDPTILALERAKRPQSFDVAVESIAVDATKKVDPFAKGNEHLTPPATYQDADDWNVRCFANKYPLLLDHEIIVHSPFEDKDIEDLDCAQNEKIIRAFLNRVSFYGSQGKEVIIFNNRGGKAGASLMHPHSQIVAAQGFPGEVAKEKSSALKYYNEKNSCFWCNERNVALAAGARVVRESSHFVVYVPSACRWSYEASLVSKNHKPNFGFIDEQEIHDLAVVLRGLLRAYDALFDRPDRNFWIHTMQYEPYHWHMGFLPHIKVFGALELGSGIWVSDKATPEDAAAQLREKMQALCRED